jgi:hypothetical protein
MAFTGVHAYASAQDMTAYMQTTAWCKSLLTASNIRLLRPVPVIENCHPPGYAARSLSEMVIPHALFLSAELHCCRLRSPTQLKRLGNTGSLGMMQMSSPASTLCTPCRGRGRLSWMGTGGAAHGHQYKAVGRSYVLSVIWTWCALDENHCPVVCVR